MKLSPRTLLGALWPQVLERVEGLPAEVGVGLRNDARFTEVRDDWRETAGAVWRKGTGTG